MPTNSVNALHEYAAEIEADTPEQATAMFNDQLANHFIGVYSFDCEELEEE